MDPGDEGLAEVHLEPAQQWALWRGGLRDPPGCSPGQGGLRWRGHRRAAKAPEREAQDHGVPHSHQHMRRATKAQSAGWQGSAVCHRHLKASTRPGQQRSPALQEGTGCCMCQCPGAATTKGRAGQPRSRACLSPAPATAAQAQAPSWQAPIPAGGRPWRRRASGSWNVSLQSPRRHRKYKDVPHRRHLHGRDASRDPGLPEGCLPRPRPHSLSLCPAAPQRA